MFLDSLVVKLWLVVAIVLVVRRVIVWLHAVYLQRKWGTKPPKSSSLSVVTQVKQISHAVRNGYLADLQKRHFFEVGAHTYKARVFLRPVILTKNPQNIKSVLAAQFSEYSIGHRSASFRPLLGYGVFAADGEHWKYARLMLRPQFAREQVGHVKALEVHVKTFAQHVSMHEGRPFDIQPLFSALTLDASTEFLLGESVHYLRSQEVGYDPQKYNYAETAHFEAALKYALEYVAFRARVVGLHWLFNSRKFRQLVKVVHDFSMKFVNKALALSPQELEAKSEKSYTILYELVRATRDPVAIRNQLLNVMLAGRSTTASLLSLIFYELSRNPAVWNRLRSEVIASFGTGTSAQQLDSITFESLKKCTYLKWVINETLRLYPPVPVNSRQAAKNTRLPTGGGIDGCDPVFVPKGQLVILHMYSVHRLEEYYGPDAEDFRPERWANLHKVGWAFLPFGSGPRVCLGQQFALTEASYVTVRLCQLFTEIESFNSGYPPRKSSNATMQHMDGVIVAMK